MTTDVLLELECGVTLELKPVKQAVALEFIGKLGGLSLAPGVNPGGIEAVSAYAKLLNYFAGWGVANEIPPGAWHEFKTLASGEHSLRSLWVRSIASDDELTQLITKIIALTFKR